VAEILEQDHKETGVASSPVPRASSSCRAATIVVETRPVGTLKQQSRFGDGVMLAFLATQVLDGVLTYRGVRDYGLGIEIEANPLIALAMGALGVRLALILAKTFAAACGFILHTHRYHGVLTVLTALYAVAAIGPWMVLLYTNWLA
jgi:hypothetical protein